MSLYVSLCGLGFFMDSIYRATPLIPLLLWCFREGLRSHGHLEGARAVGPHSSSALRRIKVILKLTQAPGIRPGCHGS